MERSPKSPESRQEILHPDISNEITAMSEEDRDMRTAAAKGEAPFDHEVDSKNTARLKEIVNEIGWPSVSKVGKWPSYNAWLIAQHAMHDIGFMRESLILMRELPLGEVDPANIAMLEDRLNVHDGLPQRYGTQFGPDRVRLPVENESDLDELRRSVGLQTIEEEEKDLKRFDEKD